MRWLSILVLALALVAAGCGGGDNESAGSDETTVEETTATEETTTEETTGETTDISAILGDEDCLALASVGATIAQAFSSASGEPNTDELEQLADKVPDEIKADVQTLAAAFSEYAAKLKDIGIEPGATPTAEQLQQLQAAIGSLNQDELTAAANRIEAWAKENCTG
jgi:Xaa-Pro aminopeptidase